MADDAAAAAGGGIVEIKVTEKAAVEDIVDRVAWRVRKVNRGQVSDVVI